MGAFYRVRKFSFIPSLLTVLIMAGSWVLSNAFSTCSCCSVTQSCLTLCDSMDCSTPGFLVLHYLLEFAQTHVHGVSDAMQPSHLLLPLLLLPSIFPSIRVFSNELAFCIKWPKVFCPHLLR